MSTTRVARSRGGNAHRPHRAFTLVEMIVVVTIIALLASIIVPRLWTRVDEAKKSAAQSEVSMIAQQVTTYALDAGISISQLDDDFNLDVLLLPPDDGGGSNGPYLQKANDLIDPWENPYDIRIPGDVNYDFDVISAGEDGEYGTEDDITN